MMLFHKAKIKPLGVHTGKQPAFPSEHLLFSVQGSTGKFRIAGYGYDNANPYDMDYRSALLLNDTPLAQMQSFGSPTCESLLAAGYGMPEDSAEFCEVRAAMDRPYAGLADALDRLRPLIQLLQPGVYVLSYSEYCPTDGCGHFFWDVPEKMSICKATAEIYESETYRVLPCFPYFLYPTQGAEKYDRPRVEYYRCTLQAGETLRPVIAYALWGYMSVLLDGHHRASACALEGVRVPALTISCPRQIWRNGILHILWPDGVETPAEQVLAPAQRKLFSCCAGEKKYGPPPPTANQVRFGGVWSENFHNAASRYPTCYETGMLALYPEIALNRKGLRQLAMDDDYEDPCAAAHLLRYAARQPGADRKSLAMAFIETGYPSELRQAAFEVLDQIIDDPEIEELMINVLVYCERKDDPIYRIADHHWSH